MATNSLVTITKEIREAGWHLYNTLTKNNFPLNGLFWAVSDDEQWRLFIITPLLGDNKVTNVYERITRYLPDFLTPDHEDAFLFENI